MVVTAITAVIHMFFTNMGHDYAHRNVHSHGHGHIHGHIHDYGHGMEDARQSYLGHSSTHRSSYCCVGTGTGKA